MTSKQSVQDVCDLFLQRRMELTQLPYITVPDEQDQIDVFLNGLKPELLEDCKRYADISKVDSLMYWMQRSTEIETLRLAMQD